MATAIDIYRGRTTSSGGTRRVDRRASAPEPPEASDLLRRLSGGERVDPRRLFGPAGAPQPSGGPLGVFTDVVENFGRDVIDVATSVPSLFVLAGKGIAYPTARVLAPQMAEDIEEDFGQAGRALATDLSTRWGPLFRGDFGEFARQAREHPGLLALDIGAGVSVVGAGARVGLRTGARAASVTGRPQLAARMRRTASKSVAPGSARFREPLVLRRPLTRPSDIAPMRIGDEPVGAALGPQIATPATRFEVPRRPYTSNVLTRPLQRGIGRAVGASLRPARRRVTRRIAEGQPTALRPLSEQFRFDWHARSRARTRARDLQDAIAQTAARVDEPRTRALADLLRSAGPVQRVPGLRRVPVLRSLPGRAVLFGRGRTLREYQAALELQRRGYTQAPGMTPVQARDLVTSRMQEGLEAFTREQAGQGFQARTRESARNIERLRAVPERLLDPATMPAPLRAAVEAERQVLGEATEMRIATGAITRETAQQRIRQPAEQMIGEARFDPRLGGFTESQIPGLGERASYVPDIPADAMRRRLRFRPQGAAARMGRDPIYQSRGALRARGNTAFDVDLPQMAVESSVASALHPRYVAQLVDEFAAKDPAGRAATGRTAEMLQRANPEDTVLVSRKTLQGSLDRAREALPGERVDLQFFGEPGAIAGAERALAKAGKQDMVAMPKEVVDAIRDLMQARAPLGPTFGGATPLQMWRRGILAYAPRWYLNNLFGNTIQFGILTGFDLKSLRQAGRDRPLGRAVPERVASAGIAADVMRVRGTASAAPRAGSVQNLTDRLMQINFRMETRIRRAAYISRAKTGIRQEGGRVRGLSDQQMVRAIEELPEPVKADVLRDVETAMGQYNRLHPVEQRVLRSVFPFYSWMRVIGLLMGSMPFRWPKRTEVAAQVTLAANSVENPTDPFLPLYNRGMVNIGEMAWRTAGPNPFQTHAQLIANVVGGDPQAAVADIGRDINPFLKLPLERITGRNVFGVPFSAPPGHKGSVGDIFGRQIRDPATGLPREYLPTPSLAESLFQIVPLVPQLARGVAQQTGGGGRYPYDTASTFSLLRHAAGLGGRTDRLYQPAPETERPYEPSVLTPFLTWAGMNTQRRNRLAELERYLQGEERYDRAAQRTRNREDSGTTTGARPASAVEAFRGSP